ncbi:UDP-forming cellulose synthase catalytic subunit [Myxococcota bacterium]|nr:UDP-forming cellulose synthase catalytic subunit [Myxococcota bacterium]
MSAVGDRSPRGLEALILGALAALFLTPVITTPLDGWAQLTIGALLVIPCFAARRSERRGLVLFAVFASIVASSRYVYWRLTRTAGLDGALELDTIFGALLLGAELYAFVLLVLGHFVTALPLRRRPVPLDRDPAKWPTVDVFIPTYDEPLDVLRPTVLAAKMLDWPDDKLRVFVLDDGRRDEVRAFAARVGAGYVTRDDNRHAKAGNLNHALAKTSGELVAIFDCDHVPTRAFLQLTAGTLTADPSVALVQTPHVFYSADPFERNLGLTDVPHEGALFYGLIQPGNDLWNAAFFCGSSAVLRRSALDAIGGIPTDSVTEDAHTGLRLHRAGLRTAYLDVPLAAGLATESLSAHVGQRMRWARGMTQIFRLDNPLVGRGLNLGQRLAYANAMLHFLFGLPRLVFMLAPLCYLLFDAEIFDAPPDVILAYAVPHLACALAVASRVQGRFRRSFWNEVYETVLAFYLFVPTTLALLTPRGARFNVTAKGGLVERTYFDARIAAPLLVLALAELAGLTRAVWLLTSSSGADPGVVAVNALWAAFHLAILLSALAVSLERRQLRRAPRIRVSLPAELVLATGHAVRAETIELSCTGARVRVPADARITAGAPVTIAIHAAGRPHTFETEVLAREGATVRLRFGPLGPAEERALVRVLFSRADAWLPWRTPKGTDRPLTELARITGRGLALVRFAILSFGTGSARRATP